MASSISSSGLTVTIPDIGDTANVVTAFTSYHNTIAPNIASVYANLSAPIFTGTITVNGGITGAAAKNMTVASLMPSGGTASTGVGVVMSAATTGASAPTKRPDGTNLVAGDIWISW